MCHEKVFLRFRVVVSSNRGQSDFSSGHASRIVFRPKTNRNPAKNDSIHSCTLAPVLRESKVKGIAHVRIAHAALVPSLKFGSVNQMVPFSTSLRTSTLHYSWHPDDRGPFFQEPSVIASGTSQRDFSSVALRSNWLNRPLLRPISPAFCLLRHDWASGRDSSMWCLANSRKCFQALRAEPQPPYVHRS